jgi:hypothetical protein
LTSRSRPQSASFPSRLRNSHSGIEESLNSTYDDGFSRMSGRSRISDTCRTRAVV